MKKWDGIKKFKRSLIYLKCGKKIEEELTYDFFAEHLNWEWFFKYKNQTIDIATHVEDKKIVYEFNVDGYDENKAVRCEFYSQEELLKKALINGKTIKEIWEDLEN